MASEDSRMLTEESFDEAMNRFDTNNAYKEDLIKVYDSEEERNQVISPGLNS
jgi:hypothetical protein